MISEKKNVPSSSIVMNHVHTTLFLILFIVLCVSRKPPHTTSARQAHADAVPALPLEWSWYWVSQADGERYGLKHGRYATHVIDQHRSGWCGACYLISAMHCITDRCNVIIARHLTDAEEMQPYMQINAQRLLDDYNALQQQTRSSWNACQGGSPWSVLDAIKNGMIEIHQAPTQGYAWHGFPNKDSHPSNDAKAKIQIVDAYAIPNRRAVVKRDLFEHGSVVLGIDAECLLNCKRGIADEKSMHRRNHAVSVVGWKRIGKKEFWIIRNTWGTHVPKNLPRDKSCVKPGSNTCHEPTKVWGYLADAPGFALVSMDYVERDSMDARDARDSGATTSPWYAATIVMGDDAEHYS